MPPARTESVITRIVRHPWSGEARTTPITTRKSGATGSSMAVSNMKERAGQQIKAGPGNHDLLLLSKKVKSKGKK